MYVAFPYCYSNTELPDWVNQTTSEIEALEAEAREVQKNDRCTIMEAEKRVGLVSKTGLCHALVLNGIGSRCFLNSLDMLNFIVLGGAVAVLNHEHYTYPLPPGSYGGLDLYNGTYQLFEQSLPLNKEDCPLHPHLVVALLRIFDTRRHSGHYQEGGVSSTFITCCSSWQYPDSVFSRWANIRSSLLAGKESLIKDLPDHSREDVKKIVRAIPYVLDASSYSPLQLSTAHSI